MPVSRIQIPDGRILDIEHPDGASERDLFAFASMQSLVSPKPYTPEIPAMAEPDEEEPGFFEDVKELGQRTLGSAASILAEAPAGIQSMFREGVEEDEELVERNRKIREGISSALGYDEEYDDSLLGLSSNVLGSILGFGGATIGAGATGAALGSAIFPGAGTLVGGVLGLGTGALLGAGSNVASGMEETARQIERGQIVTDDDYESATARLAGIGASEGLPFIGPATKVLRRISGAARKNPKAVEKLTDYIRSAAIQGTEEAAQEALAGIASDAVLKEYINPDIEIGDSLGVDLVAGGLGGALFDVGINLATRRRRSGGVDDEVKPLREELVAEEEALRFAIEQNEIARQERISAKFATTPEIEIDQVDTVLPEAVEIAGLMPISRVTTEDGRVLEILGDAPSDPEVYRSIARKIVQRLGDQFPTEQVFEVKEISPGFSAIVDDRGKIYGTTSQGISTDLKSRLNPVAVALNAQTIEEKIYQNNREIISQSKEDYTPDQVKTLQRLGRIALGPESLSYSSEAANYAGGTTEKNGFLPQLSPENVIENNIPRKKQTIAQRINVKRIKNGQLPTNRFALSEIRREIGADVGRLAEYEAGAFGVDTYRALPMPINGKYAVLAEALSPDGRMEQTGEIIYDRPATLAERQAAREEGKKLPKRVKFSSARDAAAFAQAANLRKGQADIPSQDIMGDPEFGVDKIKELLRQKNISSDINSKEIKSLAARFTGNKLRRDQGINALSPAERQLLYQKLRQLPRFESPTKIPEFKLLPSKEVEAVVEEGVQQEPVAALPSPSSPTGMDAATKGMLERAMNARLKQLGLSDVSGVVTNLVRGAAKDADGNVILGPVAEDADLTVEGGYTFGGASRVLQVAMDAIMARANKPEDVEAAVIDVLNHEVVHALRNLDVITQSELQLLERLAGKYRKVDGGQTYVDWARSAYEKGNPVRVMEEAIAEMIRDGISGRVVIDNKPAKITGKPRAIFNKIVKFFKGMFGVAKDVDQDYASFTQFLNDLEAGRIGERERGQVRTLYRLEQATGQFVDRRAPIEGRAETTTVEAGTPEAADRSAEKIGGVAAKIKAEVPESEDLMKEAGLDDLMFSRRLEGMPETFDVDGQSVEFGYHQPAVDAARRYAEKSGITYEPLTEYAPINREVAKKIAIEYDLMEDMPDDPTVKAAYDAMIDETLAQYEEILNSGLTVQFIKGDDPYGNPRNAILDVINNNHMYVFSTRDGYGMDELTPEVLERNPMLRETSYKTADGDPMLANDVFRVVHDYFGHIKNGVGFRARGEENAWQSHAAMYSPLARRAMTSETRGQNSWVNFGPEADFNATASGADTVYADQKVGLLPLWVSEEARQSDPRRRDPSVFQEGLEGAIDSDGKLQLSHFSRERIARTDPEMAGRGADKRRRYAPKGTYFGIVKADENGYRREAILGNVENTFSVDPLLIYPLNKDPYGLIARHSAGNLDWDGTLKNLNDNGFIGFWANDQRIGKVAFINQPLISNESAEAAISKPEFEDKIQFSRRKADRDVERSSQKAVDDVLSYAEKSEPDAIGVETLRYGPLAYSRNAGYSDQNGATPTFTSPSRSWFNKLVFEVQDKLTDLRAIEDAINESRKARGLDPIPVSESAYTGEETIAGKIAAFNRAFEKNELEPLIKEMSGKDVSIEQMDEFLVLRHAIERNERIRKINPSMPDAGSGKWNGQELTDNYVKSKMLADFGMKWDAKSGTWNGGNARAKTLSELASRLDKINSTTLAINEKGGLITEQDRKFLDSFYKYYTPLRGISQEEDVAAETSERTAGSGGSLSTVGKETKRAMGRSTEAVSPMATIISSRGTQVARAIKNTSFGNRLVELIKKNPNDDVWQLISPEDPKYKRMFDSTYTYVGPDSSRYGERKRDISGESDKKNWVKRVKIVQDPVLNPYAEELLGVKVDGQQYYVLFNNPDLRKAAINLDAQSTSIAINALSSMTRWMSYVNTSLNPEFVVGNFARDVQTAIANIIGEQTMEGGKALGTKKMVRQVLKRTLPSISVFYKGITNPEKLSGQDAIDFNEFIKTGSKTDWFHSLPPEQQKQNIAMMIEMANGTFKGNAAKGFSVVKSLVDDTNNAVENGVRLATFVAARDSFIDAGVSRDLAIQQASTLAKNLTVNFNRRGNSGQLLNALYLFFNASVQGTVNTMRGLNVFDPNSSRTKQGMVAAIMGFGALVAAMGDMLLEEDEFEDIEEYVRDRNMIIPHALWGGDPKLYTTIPLPYGYNVFYNMGESAYLVAAGKKSPEDAAVRASNVFLGSFSPLGTSSSETLLGSAFKTATPQFGKPLVELVMNENYFGSPIYPPESPYGVDAPASRRSFSNTAQIWKNITETVASITGGNESEPGLLEVPPDSLSYLLNYGFGGAGSFVERTFFKVPPALIDESVDLEIRDIPFVRRVLGEINSRADSEKFYERRETLQRKDRQANDILRGKKRNDYLKENSAYMKMVPILSGTDKNLRELRRQLRQIKELKNVSPQRAIELANKEKLIQDRIDKLIDRFNSRYDAVVGKTK